MSKTGISGDLMTDWWDADLMPLRRLGVKFLKRELNNDRPAHRSNG